MSKELIDISIILFFHFISDFLLQSRNMGRNKGKNIFWLLTHVTVYSTSIFWLWFCIVGIEQYSFYTIFGLYFSIFISHFITDFITSKISGYAYLKTIDRKTKNKQKYKWEYTFWCTIGFDQFIHAISLILIYNYIN